MNNFKAKYIFAVYFLSANLIMGFLFVLQFILGVIGTIIHRIGLASIFVESNTIGGAKISNLLFIQPLRGIGFVMSKIVSFSLRISGTKL